MPEAVPFSSRTRLLRLASFASVITAIILIIIKLLAWFMTGSVSLLASLIDSLMDSLASLVNLLAIHYSMQPADEEHRFGHGKAEPLAGLVQAAFISGSAVFLILHAVDRLRYPHPLEQLDVGVIVILIAIFLTLCLLAIQRYVIKQTGSTAIQADALHYATDLLTNISILLALYLSTLGWTWADPVFAIVIAIYIFYSAGRIGYTAFQQLMDRELTDDIRERILASVKEDPSILGVHDLRTRQSGQIRFVQLHLELDKDLSLDQAHEIADRADAKIKGILPDAEIIIHQDPVDVSKPDKDG